MNRLAYLIVTLSAFTVTQAACSSDDDAAGEDETSTDTAAEGGAEADSGDASTDTDGDTAFVDALLSGMWADDISVSVETDTIVFSGDGYPNHDVLEAYALADETTVAVAASDTTFTIPRVPEYSETVTDTGLGTIGLAISGGVYFNPYEGDGTSVALDSNFDVGGIPFLDACNGHPLPTGSTYHYHGVPYCITDVVDTDGTHSSVIGVLLDGFPVYGPNGEDGSAETDLDECSGHDGPTPEFPDGIYHYHLMETSPYSVTCYHGVVDDAGGGMGPPPGE